MSSTPPKPSIDWLLSERAKNTKSKDTIKWLFARKTPLSSILEADDDEYDDEAFEKALVEVMMVDRDNFPDQQVLNADREDDWKLALEQVRALKKEDMQSRLDDTFCPLPSKRVERQEIQYRWLGRASALAAIRRIVEEAVEHAQEAVKEEKEKARLKSIHCLIVDLGQDMTDCVSIQAYLSAVVFLFWAAKDVLDLTIEDPTTQDLVSQDFLKFSVWQLLRTYVALVLLIETKITSIKKPQVSLDIPFEELNDVVVDRLPMTARDELIENTRKNELYGKSFTYLPDGTLAEPKAFATVLAKLMVADKKGELKLPPSPELLVAQMNNMKRSELHVSSKDKIRELQLEEAEWAIATLGEKTMINRLVDEGWVQCINDRPAFVSEDLLSRTSVQVETKRLATIINDRLGTLPEAKTKDDVFEQDRHWHLFTLIQDLGAVVGDWEKKTLEHWIRASIYLFWAAADAWFSFPDDDTYRKSRDEAQTIAEKLLRNYLVMALIGEADTKALRQKVPSNPEVNIACEDAGESKVKEPKGKEPEATKPETKEPGAEGSGTGQSGTEAAQTAQAVIRRKPVGEGSTRETGKSDAVQSTIMGISIAQRNAEVARAWQATGDWDKIDIQRKKIRGAHRKRLMDSSCLVQ